MNIKKPIYMLGLVAATLTTSSCSDFLEVDALNEITLDQYWNEESDVESVVLGCYSALQSSGAICRMMVWGEFRSDNIVAGVNTENDASLQKLLKENITASNTYTSWSEFYDVINRCNTVLYYAPQVAERDPNYTQGELNATRAEMTALRALCYFYLIRTFKDVPYVTEPTIDDNQDIVMAPSSFESVLASLISDLEAVRPYAVTKYPSTNKYAQYARITQNAIDAMLCDMYLWKQDYAKSVECANRVISSYTNDYQKKLDASSGNATMDKMVDGFPLISDQSLSYYGSAYGDIFGYGGSRESIFELEYMDDDTYLQNAGVNVYYGNATDNVGYVKPAAALTTKPSEITTENQKVFRDDNDTRYYENITEVSASSYAIGKYANQTATIKVSGDKVTSSSTRAYSKDACHANWIIYRLTDVMLLKAEALVEQMSDGDQLSEPDTELMAEALKIVNAVNKRSFCGTTYTDITATSKSEMQDIVLAERRRELMFEGKRWYDLVRLARRQGHSGNLKSKVSVKGVANINKLSVMDAIYMPYNQDELKVNSMLKQNPAYATASN